jgi:hypothetical protein
MHRASALHSRSTHAQHLLAALPHFLSQQALERRRRAARTLPRSKSATNLGARAWLGSPNLGASPLVAEQAGSSVDRRARLHSVRALRVPFSPLLFLLGA